MIKTAQLLLVVSDLFLVFLVCQWVTCSDCWLHVWVYLVVVSYYRQIMMSSIRGPIMANILIGLIAKKNQKRCFTPSSVRSCCITISLICCICEVGCCRYHLYMSGSTFWWALKGEGVQKVCVDEQCWWWWVSDPWLSWWWVVMLVMMKCPVFVFESIRDLGCKVIDYWF